MNKLEKIKKTLSKITKKDLQKMSNIFNAISKRFEKDGAGLASGIVIDMAVVDFLKNKTSIEEYRHGEADFKLNGVAVSFKKITGKADIALAWSKNPDNKKSGEKAIQREFWTHPILLLNLKTSTWWKKGPKNKKTEVDSWSKKVPRGFYIIDNEYNKQFVTLTENNKTNSVVNAQYVYKMLQKSLNNDLFIEIPEPDTNDVWMVN